MADLLSRAYELGDMIKQSAVAADYVYWKEVADKDEQVLAFKRLFAKAKDKFAECERFGRFHPDYNEALEQVYELQAQMDLLEPVLRFKAAEEALDELLHEVSLSIARAVSDTIKVPDNNPNPKGCGSGGSCSCGSGGCG
ncbi:YlbF family regulator [Cohnella faecalis]|uniref:YlbF family regulator n=2 Tax=Cohnella faecalis TaxID=2315694 RepID=A0A398CXJ5_9BACL|nr:YlbF family regulator [Cohnella faecalis]